MGKSELLDKIELLRDYYNDLAQRAGSEIQLLARTLVEYRKGLRDIGDFTVILLRERAVEYAKQDNEIMERRFQKHASDLSKLLNTNLPDLSDKVVANSDTSEPDPEIPA